MEVNMELIGCVRCGKLFQYVSGPRVCQNCSKALEEKFMEVKQYVREHPNVDMRTLSKECDVSPKQIQRWVREDRLVFSSDSPIGIPCERCGKTIKSGRFCENCKNGITHDLEDAAGIKKQAKPEPQKKKAPDSDKMRFLG
ncbi:MAG: flagellar protein [Eubacterium sp.]|nr:flagellar protein [Eubacterium sp.]